MKKFTTLAFLTVTFCILVASSATAQQFNRRKLYNTVSVHLNAMNYFGDLVPKTSFTSFRFGATRPNLGVSYMHRFSPRLSGRGGLNYGRLSGDDKKGADMNDKDASYRYYRNLSFRNDIVEVSGVAIIDLFENRGTYLKRREFAPYVFGGIAAFHHNPKAELNGEYIALQPLGTEGQKSSGGYDDRKPYKRFQFSLPFGAGIRYKLDRQYDIGFEIGWRKTFTDYLDDVSTTYVDPKFLGARVNPTFNANQPAGTKNPRYINTIASTLADRSNEGDQIASLDAPSRIKYAGYGVVNSKRGTDNEDDWYIVSGFNFSYILTPKQKSPKFR
ncbi:MAG: outer membrane beta-barrel protein [Hymenobacteraceae bacterium]|nr:outer membrane beta-barrel protein [Hymenobacteraceae bacterium]